MSEKVECCLIAIQTKNGMAYRIVNDTSFTIGRSEDCIFQINDSSVSRVHLAVTAKDGSIWIRDNNSTFGTTINGKKLAPAVQIQIKNSDRIVLGSADGVLNIHLVEMVGGNENADTVVGYNINNNNLDIQINQTLQEAKKQAAQIIYESEFEAEKKAQAIFSEAKQKMQQSELAYNTKVEEAQKMSEKILSESQKQGHEMVQEARRHSQTIREDVEKFSDLNKKETLQQSQEILKRAHAEAELIKDRYIESVKESAVEKARKEVQTFRDLQEAEMGRANQELRHLIEQIKEKSSELEGQRSEVERLKQYNENEKLNFSRELLQLQQTHEAQLREVEAQGELKRSELQNQIQSRLSELEKKDQEIIERLVQEEHGFERKLEEAKVLHQQNLKNLDAEAEVKKAELDRFLDFKKIDLNDKIEELNQKYKDEQLDFEKRVVELKIKQLQELKEVQAEADQKKAEFEDIIAQKKRELDDRTNVLLQQHEAERKKIDAKLAEYQAQSDEEIKLLNLNLENKKSDIARALSAKQKELQDKIDLLNHSYEEEERDLDRRISELKKKNSDELQALQVEADKKRAENVKLLSSKQKELEDKIDLFNHSIQQEKSDFEQKKILLKEDQEKVLKRLEVEARDRQVHLEKKLVDDRRELEERVLQSTASLEEQKNIFNQQVLQLRQSQQDEIADIQSAFENRKQQLNATVATQERELDLKIEVLGKAIRMEQETFDGKKRELDGVILTLNNEIASLSRAEAEAKANIANSKQDLGQLRADLDRTQMALVKSNAELKENLGRLSKLKIDIEGLEEAKVQKQKDYDSQVLIFKSDLERERLRLVKQEEEYIGKLKLENANRISKLKTDAATELVKTKEYLTKEIVSYVNREMGNVGGSALWGKVSDKAYDGIQTLIQKQAYSIVGSQQEVDSTAQEFKKKQLKERNRNMGIGAAVGAVALVVANLVYTFVLKNQTPIKDQMARAAQERELELKKRKFNPTQTYELKSTYVDAVIYTKDFDKIYLDSNFQAKWTKGLANYLFNSWRIEEDKSFQIISSINALVKLLAERREAIHPDFVKEGIAKMADLETESLAKVKDILGTEVKFEAFKKFEKKFYVDEQLARAPAHESPARFDAPPPGE